MTTAAAIDIGTNSVRLLIAEVTEPSGPLVERARRQVITRLGEGVDATRTLQPGAIDRTLDALRDFRGVLDAHGNPPVRAVATSAARDATNAEAFFDAVEAAIGVRPELLSGEDEAALSFAGAINGIDRTVHPGPYLVVDIGGGSTELVGGTDTVEAATSLDVGAVRITEMFLASDPPAPEELSNAVGYVRDLLADVDRVQPSLRHAQTCIVVSGTAETVVLVDQALREYRRDIVHEFVLTRAIVEEVFRTLALEPAAERALYPGLEPGRVDVIVGGIIVLACVMRHYDLPAVLCSAADLLDGIVRAQVGTPAP